MFLAMEIMYQLKKCNYKNGVDYTVNHKLNNTINSSYEALILGDSISYMVLSPTKIKKTILNLSTTVPVSLAGNYFLIKRFLDNNNKVEAIYLFVTVELLNETLNRELTYSYFESIFTKQSEINEIRQINSKLYSNTLLDDYFISRKSAISNLECYKVESKDEPIYIDEKTLEKKDGFTNRTIKNKIVKYKRYKSIPKIPKVYLNKIMQLCKDQNIALTLIIEPSLKKANEIFEKSLWKQYLDKISLKVININDYYQFNNYAFKVDGLHLRGNDNLYYQNLINKYVLNLYEKRIRE